MTTDYIVLGALVLFSINGWRKGVLKTLLAPISMIIGCLGAFLYYRQTHNITISLSICVLSPFALRILASLILKLWDKTANKGTPLSFTSKLLGSIFGVLWSGSYVVMVLILIGFIPLHAKWFEKIQKDVVVSKSYNAIHQFMDKQMSSFSGNLNKITAIIENPAQLQKFQSTKEFETLIEDDTLKKIFSDEELAEHIQNKNYGKLLADPKIQSIMQNEQLLEKIIALNKKIMEESLDGKSSSVSIENEQK